MVNGCLISGLSKYYIKLLSKKKYVYQNVGGGLETSKINLTMLWESGLKLGIHRTTSAAFSPDGKKIAVGTKDGRIDHQQKNY